MKLPTLGQDKTCTAMLIALAAVTFIIPFCNLAFPADSPLHFSAYTVSVPGKYLTFALLGLSLDLVWGYCGFWPWDTALSSRWAATRWACI